MALLKKQSPGTLGGGTIAPAVDLGVSGAAPAGRAKGLKGAQAPSFDTTYGSAFAGRQFKNPITATPTGVSQPAPITVTANPVRPIDDAIGRKKGIYGKPGT